nr:DUF645 family protein [Vibrio cholerae]
MLSLSRTLKNGLLNLDRFKSWQPTSQLLALGVCLRDAFADCQRVAFPVPMSRGGYGCCV